LRSTTPKATTTAKATVVAAVAVTEGGARKRSRRKSSEVGTLRDNNYQKILAAAEKEFAQFGYKGASIQKIADRAGLPKANIHYYFASKEKLYLALFEHIIQLWNGYFDEVKVEDDPAEVLARFIHKKVELAYSHPLASKVFAMEIIQGAPHIRKYIRTEMRTWVRNKTTVIEEWIRKKRMKPVDPVHLIFLIWSSTQHYADFETQVLTIMNRAEYEREMIDDIARFLTDVILSGCGLKVPTKK
jgi:TetR/AcrR family transcriptional regulator